MSDAVRVTAGSAGSGFGGAAGSVVSGDAFREPPATDDQSLEVSSESWFTCGV